MNNKIILSTNNLLYPPTPLVSNKLKLIVLWSAKAGCTSIVKWFFYQEDLLEEALKYNPWIHNYREKYHNIPDYRFTISNIDEFTVLKFVRNPYERAVSSYIHMLNPSGSMPKLKELDVSFEKFITYIEFIDIKNCDIHFRSQYHNAELAGLVPTSIIKIENIDSLLPDIEEKMNLKKTDFETFRHSHHHTIRKDIDSFIGHIPFSKIKSNNNEYPTTKNFYNQELMDRVYNIYKTDFEQYNYDKAYIMK